jgi:hypothetical protein
VTGLWRTASLATALLTCCGGAAAGQTVAAAAIEHDVQRFSGAPALNRLDGSANGWTVIGGIEAGRRVAVRADVTRGGTIASTQTIALDVDGRAVAVRSRLAHRITAIGIYGGYTQTFGDRWALAYLGGVSFTSVRREFTTDASQLLLVPPSTTSSTPAGQTIVDRGAGIAAGADALVRIRGPLTAIVGVRVQRIDLDPDLTGVAIRPFAGAGLAF